MTFRQELLQQRWDDHRYYHQNRINQTLHLLSAMCFVTSYALIFLHPAAAVFIGWVLAMVLRQTGHFVFEPQTYDALNRATHEYKESVKTGYNLRRKVVLLTIWGLAPVILYVDPTCLGVFEPTTGVGSYLNHLAIVWAAIGVGAVVFRTVQLFLVQGVQTGLVWCTKILTDPFHDIKIYYKAPYYLFKGDMSDDLSEWYDDSVRTSPA